MPHLHKKKGGKLANVFLRSLNNFLLKENIAYILNYIFLFTPIFDVRFVVIVSNNSGSFIACKWSFKNRLFSFLFFCWWINKRKTKTAKKKKTTLTSRHFISVIRRCSLEWSIKRHNGLPRLWGILFSSRTFQF